ncbi:MAG: peptidoglycan-binding protein [Clostridia bacterium]|jgi:peptidoglycan hydrolase-like protein with peptidoglycan-binding domain|nr:peptidoglycan-binding protein [Clostridia bacterium]MBQ5801062.1 peptidoglycan-binding protein [Clostridia bacterium]
MYDISDKRNAIREAQRFLLELHYATEYIPHIAIDGIYGEETRNAIGIFQSYNGLPITKEIDYITWQLLYEQFLLEEEKRLSEDYLILEEGLPLSLGAIGVDVELLQFLINRLSEKYDRIMRVETNGIFNYQTASALAELQKIYRIEETGILDRPTLNLIISDVYQSEKTAKI